MEQSNFRDKYHFLEVEKNSTDSNVYDGKFYSLQLLDFSYISKFQFKDAAPGLKLLKDCGIINFTDIAKDNIVPQSELYVDIEIFGGNRKTLEI